MHLFFAMNELVHQDETIEDLQLNGLRLIQKMKGFRYGMDSVLLASFASVRANDTVVDFGTGSGILMLLLYGRQKGKKYYGIEIQQDIAEMAHRNIIINGLKSAMEIICADAGHADKLLSSCSVDAVICNPPYFQYNEALSSPVQAIDISRKQRENMLDSWIRSAHTILKGKGKLSLIYPAPKMLEIMKTLQKYHLEPKRFRLIYPRYDQAANLVLIEAVKDSKPTLHPLPPLVIYNSQNDLTNELKSVYHIHQERTGWNDSL